jgi:phosphoribosylformylglycinamidine synthase
LTNQEYFERLGSDEIKWGRPFEALLGLMEAQLAFETPAIGGKDSMSGTYKDIHVPPTLITFAITTDKTDNIVSSAFKEPGNYIYLLKHQPLEDNRPNYEQLKDNFAALHEKMQDKTIVSAKTIKAGGLGAAIAKMAFGNNIGAAIQTKEDPYGFNLGSIVVESKETILDDRFTLLGILTKEPDLVINAEKVSLKDALSAWTSRYESLYPRNVNTNIDTLADLPLVKKESGYSKVRVEKPVVVIPVFPGQNCEYDTTAKFERAGAEVHQIVFNNLSVENIEKSIDTLAKEIEKAQILMIVGGFSSGDEPDGSGKFIANVLRNPKIAAAISTMRENDGLILGICNGFQALVKSGLLPYGDVNALSEDSPTLFRNDINRHVSHIGRTRITSNASPWLASFTPGQTHSVAFSHGEGKFVASKEMLEKLAANGQIATQYVNEEGVPTMNGLDNINGSSLAIEGILSEDGRIFGKMGHSERYEEGLMQNIAGDKDQDIFANGVRFFTHGK